MIKKWLREPLLHFLLIGAALFLLYGIQPDKVADDSRQIVISGADIDRLISLWEKKWQRLPTDDELKGLVEAQIREEVLYREALAMGLDDNDTIVRRRLAQKVEFISSDLATRAEPTDADLQAYLDANPDKFAVPGRISFQHIYLNADRRGEKVKEDARQLFEQLQESGEELDVLTLGDAFMFGPEHDDVTRHEVSRLFGREFADELFNLPVGSWQGPIFSGYGLHLVRVNQVSASQPAKLEDVRQRVFDEWMTDQRKKTNEAFYRELRKRYDITVETGTGNDGRTASMTGK